MLSHQACQCRIGCRGVNPGQRKSRLLSCHSCAAARCISARAHSWSGLCSTVPGELNHVTEAPGSLGTGLRSNAMGVLTCELFTDPPSSKLENCAIHDLDHIIPGSVGDHVRRIQIALNQLMNIFLGMDGVYGERTAAAVVASKDAQSPPLRQPGQSKADNIVGIRTIKALDKQIFDLENKPPPPPTGFISLTPFGTQHDHNKLCAPTFQRQR
jgi:hypothetical protein